MSINSKIIAQNRKAHFSYEVLDKIEAGIILTGPEIKAVRANLVNLKGSYAVIRDKDSYIENMYIGKYRFTTDESYNPKRSRKLLMRRREIEKLALQSDQKGITIIPLEVVLKKNLAKIILGLCRGKKKYDKREDLKKKSQEMEIKRSLKRFSR